VARGARAELARGPEPDGFAFGANLSRRRAVTVLEITAFRSAGTGPSGVRMTMWLSGNNPLKKITDPFAALSVWVSYVRLHI
jgi:hypothetical protein